MCRLHKSIYGLKIAPKLGNHSLNNYLISLSFQKSAYDPCLCTKISSNWSIFIVIYVDDLFIAAFSSHLFVKVKAFLHTRFNTVDLGEARSFL